jgi:anti-sigma regulatory factor (Ser/Thr protein kinase)
MRTAAQVKVRNPEVLFETFRRRLPGIGYAGIPLLRAELLEFLEARLSAPRASAIALTVTEVLTNLVKHPRSKARNVEIEVRLGPGQVLIDIADDSTPFANFKAKCKNALRQADAAVSLAEAGYGLRCILRQHAMVCYLARDESPDGLNHFLVGDARDDVVLPPADSCCAELERMVRPPLPRRYGAWRLTARAKSAEETGGDFVVSEERPDCLMGVIADVMGHGPQARYFSYSYARHLRSLLRDSEAGRGPGRLLECLSAAVAQDRLLEGMIMTCLAFQLFPDGRARIASAGHPSPVIAGGSAASLLRIHGVLPGLGGPPGYDVSVVLMAPNDKIIFGTDGFFEPFCPDGDTGELLSLIRAQADRRGLCLAGALWDEYLQKTSRGHDDDAMLVIAEFGGTP